MRYTVICQKCSRAIWVRGTYESDTNATVLDDNDPHWEDACEHILAGDYDIGEESNDDDGLEGGHHDHGDSVWPK